MKKVLLILSLAIMALSQIAMTDYSMRDPWTPDAATFNPSGVRYANGITTGNEIANGGTMAWTTPVKNEVVSCLIDRKADIVE